MTGNIRFDFSGRTVLVTGAARSFGFAICTVHLAGLGHEPPSRPPAN